MNTTQQHLLISGIKDGILLLKNGGGALVIQVSAVNFGLLSQREQAAIIFSFAQMLNSLSFSIQIVIYSERLNISSYLTLLDQAQKAQSNPLLSGMITTYRAFIQTTIKENDVLDKKIFVVIPLFPLELGLTATKTHLEQKIQTVLLPRQDQIIRQLNRIGLKATQLSHQKLVEVFYEIYNGQPAETASLDNAPLDIEVSLKKPTAPVSPPIPTPPQTETPANLEPLRAQMSKTHPFVVEELT